jgi:DNA mismatch repair protein MutS
MSNAERYITPALKEMENKVLGAEERSKKLEAELFAETALAGHHPPPAPPGNRRRRRGNRRALRARRSRPVPPPLPPVLNQATASSSPTAAIPVLEQTLTDTKFVPNDTELDPETARLQILTGPNMAGKSTYIRQSPSSPSWPRSAPSSPAESAEIGLVDRIFCRVGASDDLSRGQSTFMVEMSETALILNHATDRSLVILDEIGRGTATFDGLSIAWAVAEHLHDTIGCRTLFATHYHELTDLANTKPAVANYNVAVSEWNEEIIFLHKILPGAADKSYGIQVARLAGLPKPVVERAKSILSHLELHSGRQTRAEEEMARKRMSRTKPGSQQAALPKAAAGCSQSKAITPASRRCFH